MRSKQHALVGDVLIDDRDSLIVEGNDEVSRN
jgi:hypothetical protein